MEYMHSLFIAPYRQYIPVEHETAKHQVYSHVGLCLHQTLDLTFYISPQYYKHIKHNLHVSGRQILKSLLLIHVSEALIQ